MSLYRLTAFLETSADASKSPDSVKELLLDDQFDYINRPRSSKGDDRSVAPLRSSSPSTKLGVRSPSSSPIRYSFSSSTFTAG
jgi:hypothetical protein